MSEDTLPAISKETEMHICIKGCVEAIDELIDDIDKLPKRLIRCRELINELSFDLHNRQTFDLEMESKAIAIVSLITGAQKHCSVHAAIGILTRINILSSPKFETVLRQRDMRGC